MENDRESTLDRFRHLTSNYLIISSRERTYELVKCDIRKWSVFLVFRSIFFFLFLRSMKRQIRFEKDRKCMLGRFHRLTLNYLIIFNEELLPELDVTLVNNLLASFFFVYLFLSFFLRSMKRIRFENIENRYWTDSGGCAVALPFSHGRYLLCRVSSAYTSILVNVK